MLALQGKKAMTIAGMITKIKKTNNKMVINSMICFIYEVYNL